MYHNGQTEEATLWQRDARRLRRWFWEPMQTHQERWWEDRWRNHRELWLFGIDGMSRGVVPDFGAVVFVGLPVFVAKVEEIGDFEDFFVGHFGTEVGVHGVEGDVFVPVVDLGMELHAVCGRDDFGAGPVWAMARCGHLNAIGLLAPDKVVDIMVGEMLGVMAVVEDGMLVAHYIPIDLKKQL